jgi:hypothetical protein
MRKYTHDIVSWSKGTEKLTPEEYRAYHVIVGLMYLTEGPVPYGEKEIAARCNMSVQKLRGAVDSLIAAQKLWRRDECLYNARVLDELMKTVPGCTQWDLTPCHDAVPELPLAAPRAKRIAPPETVAAFERFWANRASRVGGDPKQPALDRFAAHVAAGVALETIEAGMRRHVAALRSSGDLGTKFTPMTITWLNQSGFADDAPQDQKQNVVELDPAKFSNDDWARVLRAYRMTNNWKAHLNGPEPGRPGCLVPAALLQPMEKHA